MARERFMKRLLISALCILFLTGCSTAPSPAEKKVEEKPLHTCTYEADDGYIEYRLYAPSDEAAFTRVEKAYHIPTDQEASLTEDQLPDGYLEGFKSTLAEGHGLDPEQITALWNQGYVDLLVECKTLPELAAMSLFYTADNAGDMFDGEKAAGSYTACDGQAVTMPQGDLSSFDMDMLYVMVWAGASADDSQAYLEGKLEGEARKDYEDGARQCQDILVKWEGAVDSLDESQMQSFQEAYDSYVSVLYPTAENAS